MPALKLKAVGTSTLYDHDPEIQEQLQAGRELMKQYRETFKKLAE